MKRFIALGMALAMPLTVLAATWPGSTPIRQFQGMTGIDGAGWTLVEETPSMIRWRTPEGIAVILDAYDRAPDREPFIFDQVQAQDHFRAEAQKHHGGLVEEQVRKTPQGTYDVSTVKYKVGDLDPQSTDRVTNFYAMTASFPLDTAIGQITLMAREGSPTGTREALVAIIRARDENHGRILASPQHDPYDARFDATARYVDSDARQWDGVLPQHALSALRALMPRLLAKSRLPGVPESVAAELAAASAATPVQAASAP